MTQIVCDICGKPLKKEFSYYKCEPTQPIYEWDSSTIAWAKSYDVCSDCFMKMINTTIRKKSN